MGNVASDYTTWRLALKGLYLSDPPLQAQKHFEGLDVTMTIIFILRPENVSKRLFFSLYFKMA